MFSATTLNLSVKLNGLLIALLHNLGLLGVGEHGFTALNYSRHSDLRQRLKRERNSAVRNSKAAGGADKE